MGKRTRTRENTRLRETMVGADDLLDALPLVNRAADARRADPGAAESATRFCAAGMRLDTSSSGRDFMIHRAFTLEEYVRFVLAAASVRDTIDRDLGELMLAAAQADTAEAWSAVHDRLNVLGDFESADRIRKLIL